MGKSQEMWEDSVQNWSRTGGAGAGPAMLRLCPKRSLQIHFRKALPCFPILICSQNVFSHHTGSLLLLLLFLPIFSKFIFNLVQWLIPRRGFFNKMRNLLSLDKVFMGEEGFKVAQGERERGEKIKGNCSLLRKRNMYLQIKKISAAYA